MEMETIANFIASVGFPIVVALMMMDQNKKSSESYTKLYHELKETIDNNTKIINELIGELRN